MNARTRQRGAAAIEFRANSDDPRHGTHNGYINLGCRCARCRAAWNEYARPYQIAYRRRQGMQPQKRGRTHGAIATYNNGCRCEQCRNIARVKRAEHRAKNRVAS